jgi:diguanylate cyclase (GGDEF)-like protein
VTLITGVAEDITERKEAQDRLLHLAHYDHLTGLPNRTLLHERLKQALSRAGRHQDLVATVFLDLDHFKTVNDTLGHASGDQLLRQVAERLAMVLREDDTIGRLGGDEFAVILSDIAHPAGAEVAVHKIMAALHAPFEVDGHDLYVTVSAGISLYPADGIDTDSLLRNADAAMYRAKEVGRNGYQFFSQEMNQRARERLSLEGHLRRALERQEFTLHYQPKVEVRSGHVTGCEALLRWHNPELGCVPPARFIPLLEENGGIVRVGEWVLQEICRQLKQWKEDGLTVRVALNLSARQFYQRDLDTSLIRIVADAGVDPGLIELEITESMLMHNPGQAARILGAVKECGMRLSVDDFGTGYSSLSYLKRFPLNALKIDRSFIEDITVNPDSRAIVQAILALARSLALRTVAEGVEKEGQLAFLAKLGCDEYQGYYFAAPMPAAEVHRLLRRGTTRAA